MANSSYYKLLPYFCASTIFYFPSIASAQNQTVQQLESIQVSAAGYTQDRKDAPASISIIDGWKLREEGYASIDDALTEIPGLNLVSVNSASKTDISIRGLPGDYTLLMVNGKRQNSRESRPNGSGGFETSFLPPLAAIERVEVIRGPMSSLYGSDAMGGVVNVITKDFTDYWTGSLGLGGFIQENSDQGNYGNANFFLSGPVISDRLGVQLYGGSMYRLEDKLIGGHSKDINNNINARFALKLTENGNQRLNFDLGHQYNTRQTTPGKSIDAYTYRGTSKNPNVLSETYGTRNSWGLGYIGDWDDFKTEINLYQEKAKRKIKTDGVDDPRQPKISNTVFDAKFNLNLNRHQFTLGGQYQRATLKDDSVTDSIIQGPQVSALSTLEKNSIDQYALFLEDEISLIEKQLALTLGMRMDHHEEYGSHWSPRAYIVYHPTPRFTIRGGIAKGFRAPSIRDVSPNYGTATERGAGVIYGNPNLKPETSLTEEIGFEYQTDTGYLGAITLFNTDFKNKLTSTYDGTSIDPKTGLKLYETINVGKANIKGIELEGNIPLNKNLDLDMAYTYLNSKRKSNEEAYLSGETLKGKPLESIPKHSAHIKLSWQTTDDLRLYTKANYIGKTIWSNMRNGSGSPGKDRIRKAYWTADLGGYYMINSNVDIGFSVQNLTNQRMARINTDGGNWATEDGRRYWLNLNMQF